MSSSSPSCSAASCWSPTARDRQRPRRCMTEPASCPPSPRSGPAVGRAIFGLVDILPVPGADGADGRARRRGGRARRALPRRRACASWRTSRWPRPICGQGDGRSASSTSRGARRSMTPASIRSYVTQYAQNPRLHRVELGVLGQWMLGPSDQATAVAETAIAEARELNHEFTYTIAFLGRPLIAWFRRRYEVLACERRRNTSSHRAAFGQSVLHRAALSLDAKARIIRGEFDAGLGPTRGTVRNNASARLDPVRPADRVADVRRGTSNRQALRRQADRPARRERCRRSSVTAGSAHVPDHLRLRAELLLAHGTR